jgi:hypothetical protein
MRRLLWLLALVVTAGCAGHQPVVVVVPPVVVEPPEVDVRQPKTWYLPLAAQNGDRICAVTISPVIQPCWSVGYLREAMLSLRAE